MSSDLPRHPLRGLHYDPGRNAYVDRDGHAPDLSHLLPDALLDDRGPDPIAEMRERWRNEDAQPAPPHHRTLTWRLGDFVTGGLLTLLERQRDRADARCERMHDRALQRMEELSTALTERDRAREQTLAENGRCGKTLIHLRGQTPTHCALRAGHDGWHRDDNGKEEGEGW